MTFPPPSLAAVLTELAPLLKARKETISVVETTTGGLISASLLSVPGASEFYKNGMTLYTREGRLEFGGWTDEIIQSYRGPTQEIVAGIAKHVRQSLPATYTLCESGTAGPSGGSQPNRNPGYVAFAIATESGVVTKEIPNVGQGNDRAANMVKFAEEGLQFLLSVIKESEKSSRL
ncbi:hypothetical protein SISNIDRAFT_450600 [Sistotremastrum niveocremeum HHB9708]|uniref:CinA C-terminal domain-containing protein n=1 Tax=Sistotremastrum niveocremeum HHB9708 TaxID=1314777 RepID=A0A164YF86_9AGAM|nr:hypothetical protein SISNIDRAFT_450600 [Sistotremastrum niveocremeum HHB9708]